ncbi:MAG: efflux RND transporter periplasmic adaptor subunit [Myxococcales bacterium]|nr:efflux RND transporter periplasmic adaptor subunit [Myxococcales bacterium]
MSNRLRFDPGFPLMMVSADEVSGPTAFGRKDIRNVLGLDRRSRWKRRILVLLGLVLIAVGAWFGWQRLNTPKPAPQYRMETAIRGDIVTSVSATGTVEPIRTVQVGAEISGRVTSVEVAWNETVQEGQILARLDTVPIQTELEQALAQLEAAKATTALAQADYETARRADDRAKKLAKDGLQSTASVEVVSGNRARAKAQLDNAKANRDLAEARVKQVRTNLEKAVIRSPINGVVLDRLVEPGQAVAASFQTPVLFSIVENLSQMELHLAIDEADVGKVTKGMTATFTVDAYPDQTFPATVANLRLAPHVEQNVVTYLAVLSVDNPDGKLWPGMTATATITSNKLEGVLKVPNVALRFVPPDSQTEARNGSSRGQGSRSGMPFLGPPGGGSSTREKEVRLQQNRQGKNGPGPNGTRRSEGRVWVFQNGKPVAISVTTGITDGTFTEIKGDGLKEGDEVIVGIQETSP